MALRREAYHSLDPQHASEDVERPYKDSQFADLQFCEAEFVQAGLLPDTASVSHPAAVLQSAKDPTSSSHTPSGSLPSDLDTAPSGQIEQGPAQRRVPVPSSDVRLRLQPDLPRMDAASPQLDKKQANRDHQRRFRERRKVR